MAAGTTSTSFAETLKIVVSLASMLKWRDVLGLWALYVLTIFVRIWLLKLHTWLNGPVPLSAPSSPATSSNDSDPSDETLTVTFRVPSFGPTTLSAASTTAATTSANQEAPTVAQAA